MAFHWSESLGLALERAEQARKAVGERLAADQVLAGTYAELQGRLRELTLETRRAEPNPKDFLKGARAAGAEARLALVLRGPRDGVARGVMKYLAALELDPDQRLLAALSCALEAPEKALEGLGAAELATEEDRLLVVLAAARQQQPLDYEEFRTIETLYLGLDPSHAQSAFEARRRYDQARARRAQHVRSHLFGLVPADLKAKPEALEAVLAAFLTQDPFGTLDHLREAGGGPLASLSCEDRMTLLERVAEAGLGLASTHLDLFAIPGDPAWRPRLQRILLRDMTAGSSLIGVYALEGIHHYPFELGRIEPVLPRRISSAEALAYLKRGDYEGVESRPFSANEVADMAAHLQELEVSRFVGGLRSDIGRQWKSCIQERKLDILFADPGLKVRSVLFLLGRAMFEPEQTFETIYRNAQMSHPMMASDTPRILVLANRYYFLDVLGLNPGLLFSRNQRNGGGARTLIQDAGDYPVRSLLQVGMAIHLRIGDALFQRAPIAWNILLGQCDGQIDGVLQEITSLFEAFDTLLTIATPLVEDPRRWAGHVVAATADGVAQLPGDYLPEPSPVVLRLTTLNALDRYRETLNGYCIQALRRSAQAAGVTPVTLIQGLRMPRARTDKLRVRLEQSRKG